MTHDYYIIHMVCHDFGKELLNINHVFVKYFLIGMAKVNYIRFDSAESDVHV